MEENRNISEHQEEQVPKFRGLYRNVNISVRSLDYIIAACIAVILVVVALELRNPGFLKSRATRITITAIQATIIRSNVFTETFTCLYKPRNSL